MRLIDRSTAERFTNCPRQGWAVMRQKCRDGGPLADAGQVVHDAIAGSVIDSVMGCNETLEEDIRQRMKDTHRLDIYPTIQAAGRRVDVAVDVMANINRLMAYDGGTGATSGQMMFPVTEELGGTGEVDLLFQDKSGVVRLVDWKTGWKKHTKEDIENSFQFRWYAVLVWSSFDVGDIDVTVANTRWGTSNSVVFRAEDRKEITDWAHAAVLFAAKHGQSDTEPDPNPEFKRCLICPYCRQCDVADPVDGPSVVQAVAQTKAKYDQMCDMASKIVEESGPIVLEDMAFGWPTIKEKQAARMRLYNPKEES